MSFQWRRGDCDIDSLIENVNRRASQLEQVLRTAKSTEWTWSTVAPCDPCTLTQQINRQFREAMNLLRRNTDSAFAWRTLDYENDLDDFCGRLDRAMRRMQYAVNIASAAVQFTLDNAGYVQSLYVGGDEGETWDNIRDAAGDTTTLSLGGLTASGVDLFEDDDVGNTFETLQRGFLAFDTSTLGAGYAATTATLVATVTDQEVDLGGLDVGLYCYTPGVSLPTGGPTSPNAAFWADVLSGSSELASDDVFATDGVSVSEELTFTLNAAGLAHIDPEGDTVFSLLFTDDFDDSDPSTGSGGAETMGLGTITLTVQA